MLRRDAISRTPKTPEYRYFYGNIGQIMAIKKLLQYRYQLTIRLLPAYMAIWQFFFLYNKQQAIEKNPVKNGGLGTIREGDNELDGFELIRRYINELSDQVKSDPSMLKDGINHMLISRVSDEFQTISDDGSTKVVYFDGKTYLPRAIPVQILDYYHNRFGKSGRVLSDYYEDEAGNVADCTLSAIANNVANEMISTIELEKVFTGDPAYYKWQYNRKVLDQLSVEGSTQEVRRLTAKDADKIKRLGAILSPGQNLTFLYPRISGTAVVGRMDTVRIINHRIFRHTGKNF